MASTEPTPTPESQAESMPWSKTVTEMLDRLEIRAGKIGMNTPEQASGFLVGLDAARDKINGLEGETSRKITESQFADITARLRSESSQFLKDLGGPEALRTLRAERQPPAENWWWFLDEMQQQTRRSGLRRAAFTLVGIIVGLALATLVYNLFFAPDPATIARYEAENTSRDLMMQGNLEEALGEVEKGLAVVPADPALLTLKGVILEQQNKEGPAREVLAEAEKNAANPEEFYQMRGQAYLILGRFDDALAAAGDMLRVNPQSAQAHMLIGQVNETTGKYALAFDDYTRAFDLAAAQDQQQLAGLARVKMAMIFQLMNAPVIPSPVPTEQP